MNQLEKTYVNFIESICKMYNVQDAAEPLIKGYEALLESQNDPLLEGRIGDFMKHTGKKIVDIAGCLGLVGVCLTLPWLPATAFDFGKKLYNHHKIDNEYAQKLSDLNKALHYMDNVEINVPKKIAGQAENIYHTVGDELDWRAFISPSHLGCLVDMKPGPYTEACFVANQIKGNQRRLASDVVNALQTIAECLSIADNDESYRCKENTLEEIEKATETINKDNETLYNSLVSYSNHLADACKEDAKEGLNSSDVCDKVHTKLTDSKYDIPEWKRDESAKCDTIHKGPGYWSRVDACNKSIWNGDN